MQLSTHYYVLSLGGQTSRLYEGFRDKLIDIQNADFPFENSIDAECPIKSGLKNNSLQEFLRQTDQHFASYYKQDPLPLVLVGEKKHVSLFKSVTAHQEAFISTVEGDHLSTSPRDLGKIVWPVVKTAMAGASEKAMHDLEKAAEDRKVASGMDAVVPMAESGLRKTLFVEEDYHVRGSIEKRNDSLVISSDVDIREVIDDAVDVIIDKVLENGGNVVFLDGGSLTKFQRIALIQHG